MIDQAEQKLDRMRAMSRDLERVVVAFSAGVDSTFVLKVAVDTLGRQNVLAVTSQSASVARREVAESAELCALIGAEHHVIETDEFVDPNYLANPTNRCYFCKTSLYDHLASIAEQRGYPVIVNGTNADDLSDHRPGLEAAREHNVRAPAAEVGLSKDEIRLLSEVMGLPTFDKPAAPCLSSRVQYGEAITPEKLRGIESCEAFLHENGFRECRVRHHRNLARIEVPSDEIECLLVPDLRARIDAFFHEVGYHYVTIDLRGLRSGSMNEVIPLSISR